jgi:hypothetical protein
MVELADEYSRLVRGQVNKWVLSWLITCQPHFYVEVRFFGFSEKLKPHQGS